VDENFEKYAIIVAGGTGSRLGGGLPKQFRPLNGRPMAWWSMKAFHEADSSTRIILVVHPDYVGMWDELMSQLPPEDHVPHVVRGGGASRTASVINGLEGVPMADNVLVAVHDAARPLVSTGIISRGWVAGAESGAAVPAVAVTDSLRRVTDAGNEAVDRSEYVAVQTPQVFRAAVLKGAYQRFPDTVFSDDASATEAAGNVTALFDGDHANMKVTNPGDIEIASLLLRQR